MKTQNMILTPIKDMDRKQWLEFRQPITHAKNRFVRWLNENALTSDGSMKTERVFELMKPGTIYDLLKKFFQSEDWKNFIFPCIGGSEIATIMALNPYKSIIELYYEKTGAKETPDIDNAAMFWGRELEAQVAEKWQYWEGNAESIIENFKLNKIVRKCRRINSYAQHVDFPWIFVSLDRIINKHEGKDEGSLECKTISGYASDQWQAGIPPMYVVQLQTQLAVFEFLHGEIALLKDGRYFDVLQFDEHKPLQQKITERSYEFFTMVKAGVEQFLLYSYCTDENDKRNHYAMIESYSPEPDGSAAYENYLNQKHEDKGGTIAGTDEQLLLAYGQKWFTQKEKEVETAKRFFSNNLKNVIGDNAKLEFPDKKGTVTWKKDARGVRTMRVNVTLPADFNPALLPNMELTAEEA